MGCVPYSAHPYFLGHKSYKENDMLIPMEQDQKIGSFVGMLILQLAIFIFATPIIVWGGYCYDLIPSTPLLLLHKGAGAFCGMFAIMVSMSWCWWDWKKPWSYFLFGVFISTPMTLLSGWIAQQILDYLTK